MAHTLSITDSTTTLSLADTASTGYHLVSYQAVPPTRIISRTDASPYRNGQRTMASGLADTAVEIVVAIYGSSADNLDDRFQILVRMLESAQRWEERRVGTPVRLSFKRQGVTNTAYRVITGVPQLPRPMDPDEINWLDGSSIMNMLQVSFIVTLEPVWHAGALTTTLASTAMTNYPVANTTTLGGVVGEMPAPMLLDFLASSGGAWTTDRAVVWFARLADVPQVADFNTIADAAYYSGGYDERSLSATENAFPFFDLDMPQQWPLRIIARATSSIGTAAQLAFKAKLLGEDDEVLAETGWSSFEGPNGATALVDIGTLSVAAFQGESEGTSWPALQIGIYVKTLNGSAGTARLDYVEVLPCKAFVKVSSGSDGILNNWQLVYEDVATFGSFVMPRHAPLAYSVTLSGFRSTAWQHRGSIGRIKPGDVDEMWVAVQGNTSVTNRHAMLNGWFLTVKHLPSYSTGFRGNG